MKITDVLTALETDEYRNILNSSTDTILRIKRNVLSSLNISSHVRMNYLQKLEEYKFIDCINELRMGECVRVISLNSVANIALHNGAIICDIKFTDKGSIIICKNFCHRHFSFKMEECLVFQKLSYQEKIILNALDHLAFEDENASESVNSSDSEDSYSDSETASPSKYNASKYNASKLK